MTYRVGREGQKFEKYFAFYHSCVKMGHKARGRGHTKGHYAHKEKKKNLEFAECDTLLIFGERRSLSLAFAN